MFCIALITFSPIIFSRRISTDLLSLLKSILFVHSDRFKESIGLHFKAEIKFIQKNCLHMVKHHEYVKKYIMKECKNVAQSS